MSKIQTFKKEEWQARTEISRTISFWLHVALFFSSIASLIVTPLIAAWAWHSGPEWLRPDDKGDSWSVSISAGIAMCISAVIMGATAKVISERED